MKYDLGVLNGHSVGRILKETVRRATFVIRNERLAFEVNRKIGHSGEMDDVFTSADKKAQEIYLRTFEECFPSFGVIAEEDSLSITAKHGCEAYFTVDPLDGTKAYIRRQSHGVGTMVSLVYQREVISAYIGDINTEEVYGYRPDSTKVHRITRLDTVEELGVSPVNLGDAHAMLRNPANNYSIATQQLLSRFKGYEVFGSSIGTWMARLWKREVSAVFIEPGWETPWDSTPIIGISLKLGYIFLRPEEKGEGWIPYTPIISQSKYYRDHDLLVIHKSDLRSLFRKN